MHAWRVSLRRATHLTSHIPHLTSHISHLATQGAGYILSADLAATAAGKAAALPRLPAIEDALIGTLLEGEAVTPQGAQTSRHHSTPLSTSH